VLSDFCAHRKGVNHLEPVYVLERKDSAGSTYYHCHGPFRGKNLVVKQTTLEYARRFPTKAAAVTFSGELPGWLQGRFTVKELSGWEQLMNCVSPIQAEQALSMEDGPLGLMFCFD